MRTRERLAPGTARTRRVVNAVAAVVVCAALPSVAALLVPVGARRP